MFKRKHKSALLYVANLEIAKEIVNIFLKLYYSFFHNPLRTSIEQIFPEIFLAGRKGNIRLKQDWANHF